MTTALLAAMDVDAIVALAKRAGQCILPFFNSQEQTPSSLKANNTPVTEADIAAHDMIKEGLTRLFPAIPLLSEESAIPDYTVRQAWTTYWLVDPLDGTREFLRKSGNFSVNIALISDHQPVLGVVYLPVYDRCYFAMTGHGAFVQHNDEPSILITARQALPPLTMLTSRSHKSERLTEFLQQYPDFQVIEMGSSYKCCLLAEGKADFYPRFSQTMEWDTAASHCILHAAGGEIFSLAGTPLRYNEKDDLTNPSFIAVGDVQFDWFSLFKIAQ
jgi:3'(2'), 5'-bisphosphate nucleotidase